MKIIFSRPEDVVYEITSRFDSSVTPAEVRALISSSEVDKDVGWLSEALQDVGIDSERVDGFSNIDFERFSGVGLYVSPRFTFVFAFDESRQRVMAKNFLTGAVDEYRAMLAQIGSESEGDLVRFYEREREGIATIPGVESHWFFAPIWKNRRFLLQAGLASLLTNFFAVATSLFSMVVYNRIIPANAMSSLYVLVTGMCVLLIADYAIKTIRTKLLGIAGVEADVIIADRLFAQIIDLQYKSKRGSVGSLASVLKEYEQIREFFTSATLMSLIDMPFAIIFVVFIWLVGGMMVLPVLVGILILFLVTLYMQPRLKEISERSLEDSHNKHSVLVETLSGLETVKLLGAGGMLRRRFKNVVAKQAKMAEETKRHTFFSANLTQEVQQGVQVAVVTVGAITVTTGAYGYGAIIACTILAGKALLPFAQLAQLLSRLNQIVAGYRSLSALMKQPIEHSHDNNYISRGKYSGQIEFKNVSFTYPGQPAKALDSVSFSVAQGERVAIVGRVGSGKTTIGKLMAKLFIPDSGTILIDGVDLVQLDPAEVRENIGMVSQEPWMIAGTLEQNILLGALEASTEDMLWASKVSGVSEFVDTNPAGFKLSVSERGEGLSGGQRQAITIARALVKKAPIYIFDEPTSGMDSGTEKKLVDALKDAKIEHTLVLITHRTALLSLVDRVIVLDKGKVIGSGSVEGFMKASGISTRVESESSSLSGKTSKANFQDQTAVAG